MSQPSNPRCIPACLAAVGVSLLAGCGASPGVCMEDLPPLRAESTRHYHAFKTSAAMLDSSECQALNNFLVPSGTPAIIARCKGAQRELDAASERYAVFADRVQGLERSSSCKAPEMKLALAKLKLEIAKVSFAISKTRERLLLQSVGLD